MPLDTNRLPQLQKTIEAYKAFGIPIGTEFIFVTRTLDCVTEFVGILNYKLAKYTHELGFNPSKALNIGVRCASNERIIITSPEVMPKTNVLKQLAEVENQNVVCQVWEQNEDGSIGMSLVNSKFRTEHPGYYFCALFQKSDIEQINGWDEEFMKGYAFEDDDFGHRWSRAKLPFIVRDDIELIHQWHPRSETIPNGWNINKNRMLFNDASGTVWATRGLR
jgi:hypothetical protein